MNGDLRRGWVLITLFVLCFALRVGYVLHTRAHLERSINDEMERAALSLARTGEIANVYARDTGKSAHIAPGYVVPLALIYRIFGYDNPTSRFAQSLLSIVAVALICALMPVLARKTGLSPGSGVLAGLILALSPLFLFVETKGNWEQPWAALALITLFLLVARLRESQWQSTRLVLIAGMLLGLTALVSPVVIPAVGLLLLVELVRSWDLRKVRQMLVLGIVSLVVILPWIVRNYLVFEKFIPMRSNLGLELWIGNHPGSDGKTYSTSWKDKNSFFWQNHPFFNARQREEIKAIAEPAYSQRRQTWALNWISAHPTEFAILTLKRARLYWFPSPDLWEGTRIDHVKALLLWTLTLTTLGGLTGMFLVRNPYRWCWIVVTVGPALIYLVTHVQPRYRYPTVAVSVLLSADLVMRLWNRCWRDKTDGQDGQLGRQESNLQPKT